MIKNSVMRQRNRMKTKHRQQNGVKQKHRELIRMNITSAHNQWCTNQWIWTRFTIFNFIRTKFNGIPPNENIKHSRNLTAKTNSTLILLLYYFQALYMLCFVCILESNVSLPQIYRKPELIVDKCPPSSSIDAYESWYNEWS